MSLTSPIYVFGQSLFKKNKQKNIETVIESKNTNKDSLFTNITANDTLKSAKKNDSLKIKQKPKSDIETTIFYQAEDSIVMDAEFKTAELYKNSKVDYGTKSITANTIDMDYNSHLITAKTGLDTLGEKIGVPIMKDGKDNYEAQQIKYNYKTQKGQIKGVITKQGDAIIHGRTVKKEPDNVMFVQHAEYSTCDYRESHFCVKATKIKMVPGKKIYTKAFNMQIDDIPTILAFPFGIFPMTKKRSSGIIMPSYGDNATRGFMLLGGGFYWALNNYIGLKATTDFYTVGGNVWNGTADYRSRYSFQGNMQFSYNDSYQTKDNPKNQGQQNTVMLRWTHSTLSKGTGRLSASVNYQSAKFFTNTSYDVTQRQQGQVQSNISYSNEIKKTPFNYTFNARMAQSITTGVQDYTLPSIGLNMRQIFPLRNVPFINKLEPIKKFNFRISTLFDNQMQNVVTRYNPGFNTSNNGYASLRPDKSWYDNIENDPVQQARFADDLSKYDAFNGNPLNKPNFDSLSRAYNKRDTLRTSDSEFISKFLGNSRWTLTQNASIGTTIRFLKYFNLNPNLSGNLRYYGKRYEFTDFDTTNNKDGLSNTAPSFNIKNQLGVIYDYSMGANVNTRIYGTYYIKKWNIEGIRHTMIPTVGYSFTPDFTAQDLERVLINGIRKNNAYDPNLAYKSMNIFTGQQSSPGSKVRSSLNFALGNQLEMKIRDKKDTTKIAYKKIMLLDNLNLSTTYNIAADSFNLTPLSLTARTRILMFDINFTSSIDPYIYLENTTTGFLRRSKYNSWTGFKSEGEIQNKIYGGIGPLTNASLTIATTFKPKNKKHAIPTRMDGGDMYFNQRMSGPVFVDWNLPWSVSTNYALTFNRFQGGGDRIIDKTMFGHNISLNGEFSLTQYWKISGGTAFDVKRNQLSTTRISIFRDLHCWQASITWTYLPASNTDAFFATIGIKSPTLRDLKFERRGQPF